jgi:hypothetical protein
MPAITFEQVKTIPSILWLFWLDIAYVGDLGSPSYYAKGNKSSFDFALDMLNQPTHREIEQLSSLIVVSGWYQAAESTPDWFTLSVVDGSSSNFDLDARRLESPDLVAAFNDESRSRQRFRIETRCGVDCKLRFSNQGSSTTILPNEAPGYFSDQYATLVIDENRVVDETKSMSKIKIDFFESLRPTFYSIYNGFLPWLLIAGVMSFLICSLVYIRRRRLPLLMMFATACWVAFFCRLLVLVLVHVSSFNAIGVTYSLPLYFLSIASSGLSIGLLVGVSRVRLSAAFQRRYKN